MGCAVVGVTAKIPLADFPSVFSVGSTGRIVPGLQRPYPMFLIPGERFEIEDLTIRSFVLEGFIRDQVRAALQNGLEFEIYLEVHVEDAPDAIPVGMRGAIAIAKGTTMRAEVAARLGRGSVTIRINDDVIAPFETAKLDGESCRRDFDVKIDPKREVRFVEPLVIRVPILGERKIPMDATLTFPHGIVRVDVEVFCAEASRS